MSNNLSAIIGDVSPKLKSIEVSTDTYSSVGNCYKCDTIDNDITLYLPSSPKVRDMVAAIKLRDVNSLTINRNGTNIRGIPENFVMDRDDKSILLIYTGDVHGWATSSTFPVGYSGVPYNDARNDYIIDGDFNFWYESNQKDTMWINEGGSNIRQQFAISESISNLPYYCRITSGGNAKKSQKIEDVTLLSGQVVTKSFWARGTATNPEDIPSITVKFSQYQNSIGSGDISSKSIVVSDEWQLYYYITEIPQIGSFPIETDNEHCLETIFLFDVPGVYDIARVRLVKGEDNGDVIDHLYAEEKRRVNRYFEEIEVTAGGNISGYINFTEQKRNTPQISAYRTNPFLQISSTVSNVSRNSFLFSLSTSVSKVMFFADARLK